MALDNSDIIARFCPTTKWRAAGNDDDKWVEVWEWRGRRVDLILPFGGGYEP